RGEARSQHAARVDLAVLPRMLQRMRAKARRFGTAVAIATASAWLFASPAFAQQQPPPGFEPHTPPAAQPHPPYPPPPPRYPPFPLPARRSLPPPPVTTSPTARLRTDTRRSCSVRRRWTTARDSPSLPATTSRPICAEACSSRALRRSAASIWCRRRSEASIT